MLRPLGDFLGKAIDRTGAKRSIDATIIVESAGPIILQMIPELRPADFEVVSYQRGVLTVAVVNPTIGQEIRVCDEAMLEFFRETFPEQPFTRIRTVPLVIPDDGFG